MTKWCNIYRVQVKMSDEGCSGRSTLNTVLKVSRVGMAVGSNSRFQSCVVLEKKKLINTSDLQRGFRNLNP